MKNPSLCCPPQAPEFSLKAGLTHLSALAERIARWRERARGRALLAAMDERMLKDIGLSRAEAWREANTPFWREADSAPDRRPPYPTDVRRAADLPASKLR
jgi:uncharacterized protein YjiS (DUF1127 family)